MSSPKLGLVTVLYNAPDVLPDFFASLACQDYKNFQLYVVDNSSQPEPLATAIRLAEQYGIKTTFIDNKGDNVGVAAGNNQGIYAARKDGCVYIGLINNDLIFENGRIFSSLIRHCQRGESMVSPLILSYPENMIWYAGGYFNNWRATAPHIDYGGEYSNDSFKMCTNHSYAPTCFVVINGSVFDRIGFMDERYFAYYDDTDFMHRANDNGFSVLLDTGSVIHHKVSSSTGGDLSYFGVFHLTRNRIYYAKKNLAFPYKQISLTYTVITRLIRAVTCSGVIRSGYLKGIVDGIKMKVEK